MFEDLERFVAAHRPCGELTSDVGEPEAEGYALRVACACGAVFERWVSSRGGGRRAAVALAGAYAKRRRRWAKAC